MQRIALQVGFSLLGIAAAAALTLWDNSVPDIAADRTVSPITIPLAVLGDSTSHSYQDSLSFPSDSGRRGGVNQERSFGWLEVLTRLRGDELDVGPWVTWGRSGVIVDLLDRLQLPAGRSPRKEDYLYNFAASGTGCEQLTEGRLRQAPRLVALMDREPQRWRRGIVVIRTGLGEWPRVPDAQAAEPGDSQFRAAIQHCVDRIGDAIRLIHASHPTTRIVVVGWADEAVDPIDADRWRGEEAFGPMEQALSEANGALRQVAQSQPHAIFFDDQAWVRERWGSRDARNADGQPVYTTVTVGDRLRITNTAGNAPTHAVMDDHHPGLAYSALWAQSWIDRLNEGFGLSLTPISDEELARFVLPLADASLAAALRAPGS